MESRQTESETLNSPNTQKASSRPGVKKMAAVPIMATIQVVVPALQLHSDCRALFDRRENFLGVIGFPIPAEAREPTVGVVVCATEAELNAFDPSPSTLHSKLLRKYGFSASGRYQGSLIGFGRQSNRFVFRSASTTLPSASLTQSACRTQRKPS